MEATRFHAKYFKAWVLFLVLSIIVPVGIGFGIGIVVGIIRSVAGITFKQILPLIQVISFLFFLLCNFYYFRWAINRYILPQLSPAEDGILGIENAHHEKSGNQISSRGISKGQKFVLVIGVILLILNFVFPFTQYPIIDWSSHESRGSSTAVRGFVPIWKAIAEHEKATLKGNPFDDTIIQWPIVFIMGCVIVAFCVWCFFQFGPKLIRIVLSYIFLPLLAIIMLKSIITPPLPKTPPVVAAKKAPVDQQKKHLKSPPDQKPWTSPSSPSQAAHSRWVLSKTANIQNGNARYMT